MKMKWCLALVCAILGIALISGPASAGPLTTCPAGGTLIVPDNTTAAALAEGFNNTSCNVIIKESIVPSVSNWQLLARSIVIDGPPAPAPKLEIHGFGGTSKLLIRALGNPCPTAPDCSLTIDNADLRANSEVLLECTHANCVTDIKLSVVIASQDQQFGSPNGTLKIFGGSTDVQSTTLWGGSLFIVRSTSGNLVLKCIPTPGGDCVTDPFQPPFTPGVLSACGDPPVFPCANLGAFSQAQLSALEICKPGAVAVQCGGGRTQADLLAARDLDIEGTKLLFQGIVQILAGGVIKGKNADVETTGTTLNVLAQNINNALLAIDFNGAKLTSANTIRITAQRCGGVLTDICIDVGKADLIARKASGFPVVNADNSPPYDNNTDDTDAECGAGLGATVDKGNLTIITPGNVRRVFACEALLN